eukprot:TRINITY_DN31036_c0_g1_i2.p1 TRINITY_DN31036_c0_g1~~TRINITY_DN31036_c0_g1_i2.p1  ORF type:complete len:787 (+),score=110.21 TRINITY_DN31036_c0_g1_i2:1069-3429(+)
MDTVSLLLPPPAAAVDCVAVVAAAERAAAEAIGQPCTGTATELADWECPDVAELQVRLRPPHAAAALAAALLQRGTFASSFSEAACLRGDWAPRLQPCCCAGGAAALRRSLQWQPGQGAGVWQVVVPLREAMPLSKSKGAPVGLYLETDSRAGAPWMPVGRSCCTAGSAAEHALLGRFAGHWLHCVNGARCWTHEDAARALHAADPVLVFSPLPPGDDYELCLPTQGWASSGLVITSVTEGSAAEAAGLRAGMRVQTVNGTRVGHEAELLAAVATAKRTVSVRVGMPLARGDVVRLTANLKEQSGMLGAVGGVLSPAPDCDGLVEVEFSAPVGCRVVAASSLIRLPRGPSAGGVLIQALGLSAAAAVSGAAGAAVTAAHGGLAARCGAPVGQALEAVSAGGRPCGSAADIAAAAAGCSEQRWLPLLLAAPGALHSVRGTLCGGEGSLATCVAQPLRAHRDVALAGVTLTASPPWPQRVALLARRGGWGDAGLWEPIAAPTLAAAGSPQLRIAVPRPYRVSAGDCAILLIVCAPLGPTGAACGVRVGAFEQPSGGDSAELQPGVVLAEPPGTAPLQPPGAQHGRSIDGAVELVGAPAADDEEDITLRKAPDGRVGLKWLSDQRLELARVVDGTPAAAAGAGRLLGWQLRCVDGTPVRTAGEVRAAVEGRTAPTLRFRAPPAPLPPGPRAHRAAPGKVAEGSAAPRGGRIRTPKYLASTDSDVETMSDWLSNASPSESDAPDPQPARAQALMQQQALAWQAECGSSLSSTRVDSPYVTAGESYPPAGL